MDNFDKYTFLLTKNKDFQKLFYAKFITYMGDWFLTVPLLSIIYELTNSPLITSIVLVVQSAPYVILGSFGGYLADKFNRKVVIAVSEFLSGCAVLLIMYSVSTENVLFILVSFSFLGVVNCAYMPASDAALPNVVLRENLPEANVLNFSTWGIAAGLGAGLGGFLSEFLSRNQLFTINFLSFMFSAFLVFLIKTNLNENSENLTIAIE
jgi:Arabinose efflux permease